MEIKADINVDKLATTEDFFYALRNGYLDPNNILANKEDIEVVKKAQKVLAEFEDICEGLEILQ